MPSHVNPLTSAPVPPLTSAHCIPSSSPPASIRSPSPLLARGRWQCSTMWGQISSTRPRQSSLCAVAALARPWRLLAITAVRRQAQPASKPTPHPSPVERLPQVQLRRSSCTHGSCGGRGARWVGSGQHLQWHCSSSN